VADSGCTQRNNHEEKKERDDAVDRAETDETAAGDNGAPEDQFARAEAVEQKADGRADDAGLQLAQRHGRGNHPAVPAEGALDRQNENAEALEIGGGEN